MIVAVAIRTKDGNVKISRNSHSELLVMYPEEFKNAEQGFITSDGLFVDRKKALEIAQKNKQIITKHGLDTELYSEDIFLNKDIDLINQLTQDKEDLKNKCNELEKEYWNYRSKTQELRNLKFDNEHLKDSIIAMAMYCFPGIAHIDRDIKEIKEDLNEIIRKK